MAGVAEKLRKRRFYPFAISGETVYLRAMTYGEIDRAQAIGNEKESNGFIIGCVLMNEDGSAVFTQLPDETDKAFGCRILTETDIPTDTAGDIIAKTVTLTQSPPVETVEKN